MRNLLFLLLFIQAIAFGQIAADKENLAFLDDVSEETFLFTDRNLYLSGEDIWFSSLLFINGEPAEEELSKVMYVELFDKTTKVVAKGKFEVIDNICNGSLRIPSEVLSGAYFLRCYTNYQRNAFDKDAGFTKVPLTIVNTELTLPPPDHAKSDTKQMEGVVRELNMNLDRKSYGKREQVNINYSLPDNAKGFVNVSVALKNTILSSIDGVPGDQMSPAEAGEVFLLPDVRGVGLSGFVRDKKTRQPLHDVKVYISAFGKHRIVQMSKTLSNGSFLFSLNEASGLTDVFVSIDPSALPNSEVKINNDFSTEFGVKSQHAFNVDTSYTKLLTKMLVNHEAQYAFEVSYIEEGQDSHIVNFPSKVDISVRPDEFIDLASLEEVIYEIVPPVFLKSSDSEKYLAIANYQTQHISRADLVLLDNVPIFNIPELLKISPVVIESIDVINRPYYIGNFLMSGFVAFRTKTDDFGGYKFPEQSIFIEYQGLTPVSNFAAPNYNTHNVKDVSVPDFRTTLFWKPLSLAKEQENQLSFYTSDASGEYDVRIRAITKTGELYTGQSTIIVK